MGRVLRQFGGVVSLVSETVTARMWEAVKSGAGTWTWPLLKGQMIYVRSKPYSGTAFGVERPT